MIADSSDPDLGVYVHISRVYLFPVTDEQVVLAPISSTKPEPSDLPRFETIRELKRVKLEPRILET